MSPRLQLLLGMKDKNEEIVAGSLRGLAALVPLLGAATVTGLHHAKFFHEGFPKVRHAIRPFFPFPSSDCRKRVRQAGLLPRKPNQFRRQRPRSQSPSLLRLRHKSWQKRPPKQRSDGASWRPEGWSGRLIWLLSKVRLDTNVGIYHNTQRSV